MIAQFVRETFSSELYSSGIDVYTFHELLMKACGLSSGAVTDKETFFNITLPNTFLERFPESYRQYRYDRVVIDEGQDLMNMTAYFCLNEIIIGGWDDGKWTIYYDPNQNLFGTRNDFKETWSALSKNAFRYSLSVNCRNTRQIAQGNYAITHIYKASMISSCLLLKILPIQNQFRSCKELWYFQSLYSSRFIIPRNKAFFFSYHFFICWSAPVWFINPK